MMLASSSALFQKSTSSSAHMDSYRNSSAADRFLQTFPSLSDRYQPSNDKGMSASRGTLTDGVKIDVYGRPRLAYMKGVHRGFPNENQPHRKDLDAIRNEFRRPQSVDNFPRNQPFTGKQSYTSGWASEGQQPYMKGRKSVWETIEKEKAEKRARSLQARQEARENAPTARSQFESKTGMKLKMHKMVKDLNTNQTRAAVAKEIFSSIDYRDDYDAVFENFDNEVLDVRENVGELIGLAREEIRDIFARMDSDNKLMLDDMNEVEWEFGEMRKVCDKMQACTEKFEEVMGKKS